MMFAKDNAGLSVYIPCIVIGAFAEELVYGRVRCGA